MLAAKSLRLKIIFKIMRRYLLKKNNVSVLWDLTYFAIKIAYKFPSPESYQP